MGQSSSTGRRDSAAGRGPTAPVQQQRRQVAAGGYPGASTVAQFNVNDGNTQAIPNIGQMQNIFLEGMRPELAHLNNPQRQSAPQAQLQRTFTIRNDVNLKKNSLRLVADEEHPERYHLEFVFDAATECGVTVHYAATEISGELRPRFVPLKEGTSHPKEYRPKGMGQTFRTRLHSRVLPPPPPSTLVAVPRLRLLRLLRARPAALGGSTLPELGRPGHWAPSHCLSLRGSSEPPPREGAHSNHLRSSRPENALDMSLYSAEELKYDPSVACFPVAICLEAGGAEASTEVHSAVQSQSTFATLGGLDKGGKLVIKPLKQKIQACMCMAWHVHGMFMCVCMCMCVCVCVCMCMCI